MCRCARLARPLQLIASMKPRASAKYRVLSLAALLVPAFYVAGHVGPGGFPEAEGCGGSGARVASVAIRRAEPDALSVEVATDAFFVLDVYSFGSPVDITVEVSTEAGEPVSGEIGRAH